MECSYCGNTSGKQDQRGNCVGCGAPLKVIEKQSVVEGHLDLDLQWLMIGGQLPTPKWFIEEGWKHMGIKENNFERDMRHGLLGMGVLSVQEIRDMENE